MRLSTLLCGITLLASLILSGCGDSDFRPRAEGEEGVVYVVIDSSRWEGEVGQALRETIGRYVETLPAPERSFDLRAVELDSEEKFNQLKRLKNVVFVAPLSDTTSEANFLRQRLSEELRQEVLNGQSVYVERPDLYRREQLVAYFTAGTPEELASEIRSSGPNLLDAFNVRTRVRLTEDMFDRGRQENLEDELMERHGFAVNVQHDYVIVEDTLNTIYLRRIVPSSRGSTWRNLVIHYVEDADPSVLSPEWVYETRDSLTEQYMQGDVAGYIRIDYRRPLEAEEINFKDRYGFEVRGLWSLVQPNDDDGFDQLGMGGPFVTYAFYDQGSGRLYFIDGSVFAPGFDKREFLRQMEAIAYTFRSQEDTAPTQAAAS